MLMVISGGSGSGKSAFAEACIRDLAGTNRLYIATMYPFDGECRERIARHRAMRADKNFRTLECYTGLSRVTADPDADVLLECISNLTANEMYQEGGAGADTVRAVLDGVDSLCRQARNVVVVTNEVCSDGIRYDPETMRYLSYIGAINRGLGQRADMLTEVVFGIPVRIKGGLP